MLIGDSDNDLIGPMGCSIIILCLHSNFSVCLQSQHFIFAVTHFSWQTPTKSSFLHMNLSGPLSSSIE